MKICFYKDMYEEDKIIWKKDVKYEVYDVNNVGKYYLCEDELDSPNIVSAVGFENNNTYFIINQLCRGCRRLAGRSL